MNKIFLFISTWSSVNDRHVECPKLFVQEKIRFKVFIEIKKDALSLPPSHSFLLICDKTFSLQKQPKRMIYRQRYPTLPEHDEQSSFFIQLRHTSQLFCKRKTIKNFNLSLTVRSAFYETACWGAGR